MIIHALLRVYIILSILFRRWFLREIYNTFTTTQNCHVR